jgi:L-amino acid N-acyltransferase YncA
LELLIREVRLDDATALIGILNPIIQAGIYTVLDTPLSVEAEREFIRTFPLRGVFHVAERCADQRVIALQSIEPFATDTRAFDHVATIGTFVGLDVRRQGVGSRLAEAAFAAAQRKGYEKLFTYVRADNPDALAFYLQQSFYVVGVAQKQAKIAGRYVDEVMIEKWLGR